MPKTADATKTPTAALTDDEQRELLDIHGDAVQLMSVLRFLSEQSDVLSSGSAAAADTREGYAAVVSITAAAAKTLADRIEEFEHTVNRRV